MRLFLIAVIVTISNKKSHRNISCGIIQTWDKVVYEAKQGIVKFEKVCLKNAHLGPVHLIRPPSKTPFKTPFKAPFSV